jgi:hypothetical protein
MRNSGDRTPEPTGGDGLVDQPADQSLLTAP